VSQRARLPTAKTVGGHTTLDALLLHPHALLPPSSEYGIRKRWTFHQIAPPGGRSGLLHPARAGAGESGTEAEGQDSGDGEEDGEGGEEGGASAGHRQPPDHARPLPVRTNPRPDHTPG
jgi:hypothetical protein